MNPFKFLLRIPVPWVFVLVYLIGAGLQVLLPWNIQSLQWISIVKLAGALLFVIGAGFAGWSLYIFHKVSTTTTPGEISTNLVT